MESTWNLYMTGDQLIAEAAISKPESAAQNLSKCVYPVCAVAG